MPAKIPGFTAAHPTLTVGDTLDFSETVPDYPPSAGWTLKYRLIPRLAANDVIDITATGAVDHYTVSVLPAVTVLWDAGEYGWSSWVEKTGARHTVREGQIVILADPATIAKGTDTRTQAQLAVDDCLAALADMAATAAAGGATAGNRITKRYVIGNREMEFEGTATEIEKQLGAQGGGLLAFWRGELANENATRNAAAGRADRRRIYLQARRA